MPIIGGRRPQGQLGYGQRPEVEGVELGDLGGRLDLRRRGQRLLLNDGQLRQGDMEVERGEVGEFLALVVETEVGTLPDDEHQPLRAVDEGFVPAQTLLEDGIDLVDVLSHRQPAAGAGPGRQDEGCDGQPDQALHRRHRPKPYRSPGCYVPSR